MLVTLTYTFFTIVSLLPFSFILRGYIQRMDLRSTLEALQEIAERMSRTTKEKKLRELKARYDALRKRVSSAVFMNLMMLWVGLFTALTFGRVTAAYLLFAVGAPTMPPSPVELPFVSIDGYLNILLIILAAAIAYQPLHAKITGLTALTEWKG